MAWILNLLNYFNFCVTTHQLKISLSWYQKHTFLHYDTPETAFNCVHMCWMNNKTNIFFAVSDIVTLLHYLRRQTREIRCFYLKYHLYMKTYTLAFENYRSFPIKISPFPHLKCETTRQSKKKLSFTLIFTLGTDTFCIFRFQL